MTKISVIPKSVEVDQVTLDKNEEGQIQIKGGAVSPSLINDEIKGDIGQLVHNGDLAPDEIVNLPAGTKRLKIVVGSSSGTSSNNVAPFIFNNLTDSNYFTATLRSDNSGNDYVSDTSGVFQPYIGYNNFLVDNGEINLYISDNSKVFGNYHSQSNNYFNRGYMSYEGSAVTSFSSFKFTNSSNTFRQVKIYAYNY